MLLSFRVDGTPVPKQEFSRTKQGFLSAKKSVREWEKIVRHTALSELSRVTSISAGAAYCGPVSIIAEFHMPISKAGRKFYKHGDAHLQDPDATNLIKCTEDGLKRVLFADDNQVRMQTVSKIWSDTPGVELRINLEEL